MEQHTPTFPFPVICVHDKILAFTTQPTDYFCIAKGVISGRMVHVVCALIAFKLSRIGLYLTYSTDRMVNASVTIRHDEGT